MADTRTTALLESFLPTNVSDVELLSRLGIREAGRLSRTCKSINTFFKKPLDQLAAERVLDLAIKAEWNKMEKMVDVNPSFMFQPADGIDIDGTKKKCSPLHYLLYVHDYYGQEIFEACARKHNLLKEFVAHAHTQQTEFDLQPFCQVYESYLALIQYWNQMPQLPNAMEDDMEDNKDNARVLSIDNFWRKKIGNAQLRKLPRHMLKQMCTPSQFDRYEWDPQSTFDDAVRPPHDGCFANNYKGVKFDVVSPASLVGINYALARGRFYLDYNFPVLELDGPGTRISSYDFEVFKALFAVRKEQQLTRISRLEDELQVMESMNLSSQNSQRC